MPRSSLPDVQGPDRYKPLCYDPKLKRFISFDEIVSGKKTPVSLDALTEEEKVNLVLERNRQGPDYTVQSISGKPMTRDEVVREIEAKTEFGRMTVDAELSYLKDFIATIEKAL